MNKYFTNLKIIQAVVFLTIPLILYLVNGSLLKSISAYAYYTPMTFALSLTLAGALFLYDGWVDRRRWYNIGIGISLFGVVLFPHIDYFIIHYIFATLFFISSVFTMIYFSSGRERFIKIIVGSLILFGMCGCFIFNWYSIFWGEWIGMIPISIHFILESLEKID